MTPTTIGRYQIIRPLGSGGMADVYLARDTSLGREVAIKIPQLAGASSQMLARFKIEAKAVARLEHPAIAPLYEYGNHGGRPFLVMRYLPGGSLADRIGRRVATPSEAIAVIDNIAAALDYAHAHGIVHRDVKPGNILFDETGAAWLTDFGIARVANPAGGKSLTQTGLIIGTVAYMSPEQALGRPLDGRSDIYSLGVVIFEMLTGDIPYNADSQLQQAMQHVNAPIPDIRARRPDLPPALQNVINRALAKDPAHRYPTGAALAADLRRVAGGGRPSPFVGAPVGKKGTPAWIWLIALVGLALAGFVFLSGGGAGSKDDRMTGIRPTPPTGDSELVQAVAVEAPTETAEESSPSRSVVESANTKPEPSSTYAPVLSPTPVPPTPTAIPPPTNPPDRGPESLVIGRTSRGTAIEAVRFGSGGTSLIFIGGLHAGYSPGSVALANQAIAYFSSHPELVPNGVALVIVISASPDTPYAPGELPGRLNSNGVDANRNWDCRWAKDAKWRGQVIPGSGGTAPFSEPEVRDLADFILAEDAAAVVFWEARADGGLVSPGNCDGRIGPSGRLASLYGGAAGYRVDDFESLTNQELNGDGTNWLDSIDIPAISVLLPRYDTSDWEANLKGIMAVIKEYGR